MVFLRWMGGVGCALSFTLALASEPSEEVSLEPTPLSQESSINSLRARVRDWKDDERRIQRRRKLACALSVDKVHFKPFRLPRFASEGALGSLPDVIRQMLEPYRRGDDWDLSEGVEPVVVAQFLKKLEPVIPLTSDESAVALRLTDQVLLDPSDVYRLLVDVHWFLMRVTERLYREEFDRVMGLRTGWKGFVLFEYHTCHAYWVRTARDRTLVRAAEALSQYLRLLERELES